MPDTDPCYIIPYAVWIPGLGWLKKNNRVFVDARREVAETAAWLWGDGAYVVPHDSESGSGRSALNDLESDFLNQEEKRNAKKFVNQLRKFIKVVTHGLRKT